MAVEKATRGLASSRGGPRRRPRHSPSVHSTLAEPCRHRDGHLHERKRQRAGGLEPGSLSRRSIGRVSDVRVDPRDVIVEIDFEMFPDRLNTIGISAERIGQFAICAAWPQASRQHGE